MPELDWIGKEKVVNHHLDVPYKVLERKYSYDKDGLHTEDNGSENMIIHGDNLEALKSILPQYEGKIDCIYIDPPYNTGNENWVYNDNVNDPQIKKWLGKVVGSESEDLSRHDKWLCMIYPRLKLLYKLLSKDGVIFISIDDNEQANLKLVCDEIFGKQNFISESIVQSNSAKNNADYVSVTHEYLFIYAKDINSVNKPWKASKTNVAEYKSRCQKLYKMKLSSEDIHKELLALVKYPRFFEFDHYTYADAKDAFRASDLTAPSSKNFFDIIHPVTKKPCKLGTRGWGRSKEQIEALIKEDKILFGKDETTVPQLKDYLSDNLESTPRSVLFFDTQTSTKYIKDNGFIFDFPKPIALIEYILEMIGKKDITILDSFAGSGTTAHAIINANKKDGGNRKFILIELMDYANDITAERVKRVINENGKSEDFVGEINSNFSFYELGEPLLINNELNENINIQKIREYVYFMETKCKTKMYENEPNLLGINNDTAYYFYYLKNKVTTLNREFLATIKTKAERYVIYADICTLSESELDKYNITFKKIPRDIAKL